MNPGIYQILSNNTILNGTLVRVPVAMDEQTTVDQKTDDSDAQGAMHFIVATILVYSILGVFCTLILRIKRIRGKSHINYMQDENVVRYLKSEEILKMDGHKLKIQRECIRLADKLRIHEERQKLIKLESDVSRGEFSSPTIERPRSQRSRRKRRGNRQHGEIGGTIGKMGVSLFYIGEKQPEVHQIDEEDSELLSDESSVISENEANSPQMDNTTLTQPDETMVILADINSNNSKQEDNITHHQIALERDIEESSM